MRVLQSLPAGVVLRGFAVAAILAVGACATFSPPAKPEREPAFQQPGPLAADRAGVALALSGGAARGYAHIGVIKALEAHGLRPDIVVGSSAGAIVGALYASGLSALELERAMSELSVGTFNDLVLPGLGFMPGELGLIKGEKLRRFVEDRVKHRNIEDFPLRFGAVATDLVTGRTVIFNSGDAGLAVHASSAVPGILVPAQIGGRMFGDGQISSPLPVEAARKLGARTVIAVDVIYPPQDAFVYSVPSVVFQAFTIAMNRVKSVELATADVAVIPDLPRTSGQMSFGDRDVLVAAGEKAALQGLESIRRLFRADQRSTSVPR